ncbi:MAG: hypothetical protein LBE20_04490 [Deltaproteobacteria bacterium]|jgi:hypothetical protein|nr:hypothetical protein [Deltaproteobacteria bacterium]
MTISIDDLINNNQDLELQVEHVKIQVGGVYPIYGMITDIVIPSAGNVLIELNKHIHLQLKTTSQEKIDILKERILENAIFISKVQSLDPLMVECQTIIFGRKPQIKS